jgi:hypothetical protein
MEFYQRKPYLYVWYWIMSISMLGWWYILVVIDRQQLSLFAIVCLGLEVPLYIF